MRSHAKSSYPFAGQTGDRDRTIQVAVEGRTLAERRAAERDVDAAHQFVDRNRTVAGTVADAVLCRLARCCGR